MKLNKAPIPPNSMISVQSITLIADSLRRLRDSNIMVLTPQLSHLVFQ